MTLMTRTRYGVILAAGGISMEQEDKVVIPNRNTVLPPNCQGRSVTSLFQDPI